VSDVRTATAGSGARKPRGRKTAAQKEKLRLRLATSGIATPKDQKATIRALGFRRVGEIVERPDTPEVRGRILKIRHLVEIISA
jgi:large subunit ribosomal protein L30